MSFRISWSEKYLNDIIEFQTIQLSGTEASMLILTRRVGETITIETPAGERLRLVSEIIVKLFFSDTGLPCHIAD